jgi:hypothetical protein
MQFGDTADYKSALQLNGRAYLCGLRIFAPLRCSPAMGKEILHPGGKKA